MYRIIKLKKVTFSQANVARVSCVDVFTLRSCSLCNTEKVKLHSRSGPGFIRNHSTGMLHTAVRYSGRKKRSQKSRGKMSELLAVDFFSATEKKAPVTPLKVNDVTQFVKNPTLSLQELYKLRSKSSISSEKLSISSSSLRLQAPEFSNESMGATLVLPSKEENRRFNRLSFMSYTSSPLLSDPSSVILPFPDVPLPSSTFLSDKYPLSDEGGVFLSGYDHNFEEPYETEFKPVPATHSQPALELNEVSEHLEALEEMQEMEKEAKPFTKKSKNKKSVTVSEWNAWLAKYDEAKKKRRDETALRNLETYLEVCVASGLIKHGVSVLHNHCKRLVARDKAPNVTSFEILLKGAASNGSLDTVRSLLDMMHSFSVNLSLNSYAACLECLGRLNVPKEDVNMISALLEDMKIHKVSVRDIFTRCEFYGNQRSMVLKAIKAKIPDFESDSVLPCETYSVKLLSALNDTSKAKAKRYKSPAESLFSYNSVSSWIDEQIRNDLEGTLKIPNISYRCDRSTRTKHMRNQVRIEMNWAKALREGFCRDFKMLRKMHTKKSNRLALLFKSFPPNEIVKLMMQEVCARLGDSEMFSPPMSFLYINVGLKLKRLHDLKILSLSGSADTTLSVYKKYCKWYLDPQSHPEGPSNPREIWQHLERHGDYKQEHVRKQWPSEFLAEIGKFLYTIILRDIKINVSIGRSGKEKQDVPAFYTIFRKHGHTQQEQLKMHPSVNRIYQPSGKPYILLECFDVPMLCPPMPWINTKQGAFPLLSPNLLRLPTGSGKRSQHNIQQEFHETSPQQIYPSLDALNQLGSIPWKVNSQVLDIVTEVFNSGGSPKLSIPHPPTTSYPQPEIPADATREDRMKYHLDRVEIRKQQSEMYSLWCDALYRLSLAHHFRDKMFWLPHNMDFRGRVYPIAPHLQHMGCDMARSILCFAKGEKLGPDGLDWLKIHAINLTGLKKRDPLAARLEYANQILDKIFDSADHPLTGEKWWMESDEPWQTLAVCMEITAAVKSGDPENFVCHFPVHQDGSCNGLQHYAALGRDAEGAASVNLAALEKPADVYSRVAEIVERRRNADAEGGDPLAESLQGFITRKVVKQTVMTTVYGVTRYGARLQIAGQLKDLGYPQDKNVAAATYLAGLTFDSIGEMFTSTQKIQNWLTDCATAVSKLAFQPVRWVTPLGLPVVQPYFKQLRAERSMKKVDRRLLSMDPAESEEIPNVMKQKNGFPPNFIHSLDSCHMMMTALFCEQSGITYVSVHDCFWVHPCNVHKLNKICRDQFVALHSEPILEDLSQFLLHTYTSQERSFEDNKLGGVDYRYLKRVLGDVPPKGNFNLQEVLSSVYFFS